MHVINTKNVVFSNATMSEAVLSKVIEYYISDWPVDITKLPILDELRYFWNNRNDTTINNLLIYINDKIIVPFNLRN